MYNLVMRTHDAPIVRKHRGPAGMLTIQSAASILGVCAMTLRRWDRSGKFQARRHPLNSYRLYRHADVLELRAKILGVR